MKKILLTLLAALLLSLPSNAQWFVGGFARFMYSHDSGNSFSLNLAPDIGYSFGTLSVGASVNAYFFRGIDAEIYRPEWRLGLSPYLQYYFLQGEHVSLFLEGGVEFSYYTASDSREMRWAPYVTPGLDISLNDHWSVIGYIGRLEYDSVTKSITLGSDMGSFGLGLYYLF